MVLCYVCMCLVYPDDDSIHPINVNDEVFLQCKRIYNRITFLPNILSSYTYLLLLFHCYPSLMLLYVGKDSVLYYVDGIFYAFFLIHIK